MFTWTKWEVEKQLAEELSDEDRKAWYAGTYDNTKPRLPAAVPAPRVPEEGFVAASSFQGARRGFVFKQGASGLSYYVDHAVPVPGFVAAESFEGARPGFVFKRGRSGLGYYPDDGLIVGGSDASGS